MSSVGIGRNQGLWIAAQSVKGTYQKPLAADYIALTGDASFKQDRVRIKDKEKRYTLGEAAPVPGPYKVGDASFSCYIRVSGALGVAPTPDAVLAAVMGAKTVVAGTSVTYGLAGIDDEVRWLSAIYKDNAVCWYIRDLVPGKLGMKILAGESDDALLGAEISGLFLWHAMAGTDALAAAVNGSSGSPVTAIPVASAKRFMVGAYIVVGSDDNAGAGHLVTATNVATNIVTIQGGVTTTQAQGAIVRGWTPSIITAGYRVHGRFGAMQEATGGAYTPVAITEATFELDRGLKGINDEKPADGAAAEWPTDVALGDRTAKITLARYMRPAGADYYYDAAAGTSIQVRLPAGDTPGRRMIIEAPNGQIESPTVSGDAERKYQVVMTLHDTAVPDSAVSIIFN